MANVKVLQTAYLHTTATQVLSGSEVKVCAASGGNTFTPIDLLASSLGACTLTMMGVAGQHHGFETDGCTAEVSYTLQQSPHRVERFEVVVDCRAVTLDEKQRKMVERSANTCPVKQSLHPDVVVDMRFIY